VTEIQQNRWDQLIRRTAGIVGGGSQVNDTLNELFPVLDIESLRSELQLPATTRLAFSSVVQNALAANTNHAQLFNPTDSGALVILERVDMRVTAAQQMRFVMATTALANFNANHALRDTRTGILSQPIGQVRDVQQVAGVAQFGTIFLQASVNETINDKDGLFVLAPGTGITFATTTINTGSSVSFWWRERIAEASELNF